MCVKLFSVLITVTAIACLSCVSCIPTAAAAGAVEAVGNVSGRANITILSQRTPHRCIHDELQKRVMLSGMPHVRIAASSDAVDVNSTARAADTAAEVSWEPLRIKVFTDDLHVQGHYCERIGQSVNNLDDSIQTCTDEDDILTLAKRDILLKYMLPSAVGLHERYLQVQRFDNSSIVVPEFNKTTICGLFTIPSTHYTEGVANADFVLYAASTPSAPGVAAWATTCALHETNSRPVVGVTNIITKYVERSPTTVRTASHELLHALGFSFPFMEAAHIVTQVKNVRGKPRPQFIVNGTNAVREAQRHYGCDTLQWVELEDEGGDGTAASHWERRNAKEDLMAGMIGIGYYTAITIAAMEDLGYYKGNYAEAEVMLWGRDAGCDFLNEKCMTNNITKWPSMFCNDTTVYKCDHSRYGVGICKIDRYIEAVPEYVHYFTDPELLGSAMLVDFCPVIDLYVNMQCVSPNAFDGMIVSPTARCLDVANMPAQRNNTLAGICADIKCNATTSTYQVRFDGTAQYIECTEDATIDLSTMTATIRSGIVTCAPYNEVCGIHNIEVNSDISSSHSTPATAAVH